jgi:hypothetical protein
MQREREREPTQVKDGVKTQILGVSGSAMLLISAFLPVVGSGIGRYDTLFQSGGSLGGIFVVMCAISFLLTILDKWWWTAAMTAVVAITAICRIVLALVGTTSLQLELGFGFLTLGTVMICTSVVLWSSRATAIQKRSLLISAPFCFVVVVVLNSAYIPVYGTVSLRTAVSLWFGL